MNEFSGLRFGLVGPLAPPAGGMASQTRQLAELLRAEQASVCMVQSNAPYRPAWAPEKTFEHLQNESGKHFEPRVVDMFRKMMSL